MSEKMTPEELEKFIHRELRALPPRKAPAGFASRLEAAVAARTTVQVDAGLALEQAIHRELRGLPVRRAPHTLEARVLAEIERRAHIAWYHKSWSYWPSSVRIIFMVLGTALAGSAVAAFYLASEGVAAGALVQEVSAGFSWINRFFGALSWTINFGRQLLAGIPSLWLYGGLAFFGAMYATFVGVGTAAYRYLYRNR